MANKPYKDQQSDGISDEVSIASPSQTVSRLRGSHPSHNDLRPAGRPLQLRPRDDDDPEPDDDPTPPPPPPPPVSTPDLGAQVLLCLDPSDQATLVSAVRQVFGPTADVRTACVNNTQRLGIWLRPVGNEQDNQARNRGLARLNVIAPGEILAFFISSALIRRQALEGWNAQPKRLDGDGNPDADGPVHLTGFSLTFQSPNKVVTRVDGFDERPWPDVDFSITTTDTLSLSAGQIHCSSERDMDVDTGWLDFLTGLFLIVLPPLGVVFLVERIIVGSADGPNTNAGAGCGAVALLPREIFVPGGMKVVPSYSRLQVATGGIFAGGFFDQVPRAPEVRITGVTQISVEEGTPSVTRSYSLRTDDMRGTLRITWSGDGVELAPTAQTTGVRFNIGNAQAGQVLTRRVAVTVLDEDNLTASAEVSVRIHVAPGRDDDDFPPVCRVKPWLPQCEEPMARRRQRQRQ